MLNSETHRTLADLGKLCEEHDHYYMLGDLMPGRGFGGVAGQICEELKNLKLLGYVESVPIGKPVFQEPLRNHSFVHEAYRITDAGKKYLDKQEETGIS